MKFVRPGRRALVAAAAMSALLVVAACGGGGEEGEAPAGQASGDAEYDKKGPITYVAGKDTSGYVAKRIAKWNEMHPDQQATFLELPESADQQRQQMVQNAQIKSDKHTILSMDVVWTAEFAANGIVDALPEGTVDTSPFLPATVDSATYFDKLYAFPNDSDGGLLYYRSDLLEAAGLEPPATWDEMKAACDAVITGDNADMDCFAGQYDKYEGLTCNFAEAVQSAGGTILGPDGKPAVNSPEATKGLDRLANWFKDGTIPAGAITWKEENGRQAFQDGKLVFHRNWGYVYARAQGDASSKVKDKFAVAPLPGETAGSGSSTLGGHNLAIAKYGKNKGTAVEFAKWWSSEEEQKLNALTTSSSPSRASLYSDPELTEKFPHYEMQLKSIEGAQPRPKAVKYGDVTLAIQDAAYSALQGQTDSATALSQLQTKLETLIQ